MWIALLAFTTAARSAPQQQQQIRIVPGVSEGDAGSAREKEPIELLSAVLGEAVDLGNLLSDSDVAGKLTKLEEAAHDESDLINRCVTDLADAMARQAVRQGGNQGGGAADQARQAKLAHALVPILLSIKAMSK